MAQDREDFKGIIVIGHTSPIIMYVTGEPGLQPRTWAGWTVASDGEAPAPRVRQVPGRVIVSGAGAFYCNGEYRQESGAGGQLQYVPVDKDSDDVVIWFA